MAATCKELFIQCFIHYIACGSHYRQLSAGATHTLAVCTIWVTRCEQQLQAEFFRPAVATYIVPDYLLSFWVGRISKVQLVIMSFVPGLIIFLKAFILSSTSHITSVKLLEYWMEHVIGTDPKRKMHLSCWKKEYWPTRVWFMCKNISMHITCNLV